jgi:hypothetical protein
MPKYRRIKFKIDGFTPLTLPMARLAEYIKDLATLLGAENDVHFERVAKGSAALVSLVHEPEYLTVRGRIIAAEAGNASPEANRAYRDIRALLRQDMVPAKFVDDTGRKIVAFPKLEVVSPQFGSVAQEGTLEGVLIKIGGRDETVPAHLQDAKKFYKCNTTRQIARQLAPHLFSDPIRVFGKGKWNRNEFAEWNLEFFQITHFERLDDEPLPQLVDHLRDVQGSDWDKIHDPLGELNRIRKGTKLQ